MIGGLLLRALRMLAMRPVPGKARRPWWDDSAPELALAEARVSLQQRRRPQTFGVCLEDQKLNRTALTLSCLGLAQDLGSCASPARRQTIDLEDGRYVSAPSRTPFDRGFLPVSSPRDQRHPMRGDLEPAGLKAERRTGDVLSTIASSRCSRPARKGRRPACGSLAMRQRELRSCDLGRRERRGNVR